ncbi:hypothetical protein VTI74DRAFT_3931 [Chaetomium olivicolor]
MQRNLERDIVRAGANDAWVACHDRLIREKQSVLADLFVQVEHAKAAVDEARRRQQPPLQTASRFAPQRPRSTLLHRGTNPCAKLLTLHSLTTTLATSVLASEALITAHERTIAQVLSRPVHRQHIMAFFHQPHHTVSQAVTCIPKHWRVGHRRVFWLVGSEQAHFCADWEEIVTNFETDLRVVDEGRIACVDEDGARGLMGDVGAEEWSVYFEG